MSRIIPSLNLNKTPQSIEDRSLVYAKNIRMFPDQTFGPDNAIVTKVDSNIINNYINKEDSGYLYDILGHINGIDNNIYLFVKKYMYKTEFEITIPKTLQSISILVTINKDTDNETDLINSTYNSNVDGTVLEWLNKNIGLILYPDAKATSKIYFDVNNYLPNNTVPGYTQESYIYIKTNAQTSQISQYVKIDNEYKFIDTWLTAYDNVNKESGNYYGSGVYCKVLGFKNYDTEDDIDIIDATLYIDDNYDIYGIKNRFTGEDLDYYPNNIKIYIINKRIYIKTINNNYTKIHIYLVKEIVNRNDDINIKYPLLLDKKLYTIDDTLFEIKEISTLISQEETLTEYKYEYYLKNCKYDSLFIKLNIDGTESIIDTQKETFEKETILDYKELTGAIEEIKSGWKWSGGIIEGVTTVNNTNQPILNIGEYFEQDAGINVPIKHINIKECKETDDESIYTQAPNVPLTNFILINTFTHAIPNGVYQFFVRYKIRDNFYTNWFVCSKECFAGSRELTNTIFGSLSYVNVKGNAGSSFVFSVEHLHPEYFKLYEGYQVGYILTTDDKTVARSWKTFTFEGEVDGRTNSIYFDLNEKDIQEVDIDEMLSTPYNIYNAKNIDYFRGKLYISNYKEDNFNPNNLSDYINKINIDLKFKHFTIQSNNDFFHERLLTPSPETLGTYIQIQDTDINSLIYKDNDELSLQIKNPTKDGNTIDYDFDTPLCYIRTVWNADKNPDMLYIDQTIGTNIIGIPERNDSGRSGDWHNFFTGSGFFGYMNVYEKGDNEKHWLKGNKYLDGIWYWTEQGNNFGQIPHGVRDNGIGTADAVNNYINTIISKLWQVINENCPNRCIVTAVKLSLGTDETLTTVYEVPNHNRGDRHNLLGDAFPITDAKALSNFALNKIRNGITKLDNAGYFYYGDKVINEIKVEYSEISYKIKNESDWSNPFSDNSGFNSVIKIDSSKTNYTLSILCTANTALFDLGSTKLEPIQYNTLMPYTDYDFYIHYITKTGVITNGIYICSKKVTEFEINSVAAKGINKSLIYPEITGIEIPEEYESCFISYYKHNNNVAQCFNILIPGDGGDDDTDKKSIRVNILEADMLLYRLNDKIQIYHRNSYNDIPILIGDYYSSNSTKSSSGGSGISFDEFGNAGIIKGVYNKDFDVNEEIEDTFDPTSNTSATNDWNISMMGEGIQNLITNAEGYETIKNDFSNCSKFNSYVTINFNGRIISTNRQISGRPIKPEELGSLNITLLLNGRPFGNNTQYIQNFLNVIFDSENNNIDSAWSNFYNSLGDGTNNTQFGSLYNFEEFGKNVITDAKESERIRCQVKKISTTDGLRNNPVICTVHFVEGKIPQESYYTIDFDYSGSRIGISYTDINGIPKIYEIGSINIIHGCIISDICIPNNKTGYSEETPKTLATKAFENVNSEVFYPRESTTAFLYAGYIARSYSFREIYISPIDGDMWCRNKAYTSIDETAKKLIKLTPYLTYELNTDNERLPVSFNSYTKMNTDSYICQITKPDRNKSLSVYAAGNDLYKITRTGTDMKLDSVNSLVSSTYSDIRYIYSNFNLNYMSLSYDLIPKLRANLDHQQLYLSPESAELSNCYKLESMYKDFARKYFAPYNKYNMIVFDNTVRSSDSNTDEIHRSIYRFDAEDMYNIPANRGKITKMFSIANAIYIHTEHSLFKFSGENTLSGSENDVKLEESNVFDTGISEIFDSENGFGGLHEKHNCLITYKNYFFYDTRSKLIYVYTGNEELQNINEPIKKLFDFLNVSDVRFGSDLRNDRIFIYLKGEKGNVCLSYNPETKHYVSIHDINIIDSFSTRNNLYFISKQSIGNKEGTISLLNGFDYNAFGNYGNVFAQSPYITNKELSLISTHPNDLYCVIDVIINSNPEDIKNLDNVSWICHHIKNYLDIITSGNYQYYDMDNAAEEAKYKYPGEYIQLYTDSCDTGNIELYDISNVEHRNVDIYGANAYSINNELSYKYPRYNEGVWNLNYFRNIKGVIGNAADNKSLIYGKYIVARFIFKADYNFKLENVMFNVKSR